MIDDCYLSVGSFVKVIFGRNDRQVAVVTTAPYWRGGYRWLRVRKWRAKSKRWTNPVRLHISGVFVGIPSTALPDGALVALTSGRP